MKDISLHILDIVQNSVRANAKLINIDVEENEARNLISIKIKDNGSGMPPEMVKRVTDPFVTSRTTRKVGMGIPLLKQSTDQSGGDLMIISEPGMGTTVIATFQMNNIDTPPLGDVAGVISLLITGNPDISFIYIHQFNENEYCLNTHDVKEVLGDTPINTPKIATFLREMIAENIEEIRK